MEQPPTCVVMGNAFFFFYLTDTPRLKDYRARLMCMLSVFIYYLPKSRGRELSDMSFRPRMVRFFNWTNPAGSRGIGLLLKSAT